MDNKQEKKLVDEKAAANQTPKKFPWKAVLAFVIIMGIGYGVGFGVRGLMHVCDDVHEETTVTVAPTESAQPTEETAK